jgi:CHAD domain-containing protein
MPAELQRRAAGTREALRIVGQEIAKARAALKGRSLSDSSIHRARRSIKKARAVWRLLRAALPRAIYRPTNTQLRDADRPLGAARDAKILIVALDRVLKMGRGPAAAHPVQRFRRTLMQNGNAIKRDVLLRVSGVKLARRALTTAYQRVRSAPVGRRNWSVLGKGLKRVYRHGRRLQRKVQFDRRAACLHAWRKQVKYLRHQLTVLKPLWRGPIGKFAHEADRLSECLGEDHDLVVLRAQVLANRDTFSTALQRTQILAAIDRSRADLQRTAIMLGALIYEEKPTQFAARFGDYWREWRRARRRGG